MPHATLQLLPSVDVNRTPALNQAAISSSSLIRYMPDPNPNNPGLIQKRGGWTRYYPNAMPAVPRALWAWEDTNAVKRLAVGTDIASGSLGTSFLGYIQGGVLTDITPRVLQTNPTPNVSVSTTSSLALITDAGVTVTNFDAVFVPAHISVGSILVFGLYQTIVQSASTYDVPLEDQLGNPLFPPVNASGGTVADFTTTNGSSVVTVHLNNHGFVVGQTYPVLITTQVGGITLSGNTLVQSVLNPNQFTIQAQNSATSGQTVSINGGSARFNYYLSFGGNPPPLGFGQGPFGGGGFGTGTTPTASTGAKIATRDWNLDNFGENLIALPTMTTFGSPDGATYQGGPLFYWSPELNLQNATPIAQGPNSSGGMFVAMPQRQIVAYATTVTGVPDPLLVRWCDIDDFTVWIGQVTNQAGQYRIPRGSRIVGGLQVNLQGLLWTDLGLWTMQYIGVGNAAESVYSFNEIGTGCGLISQKAVATISGTSYWMGQSQFFSYSADGGVAPLICPVWDDIFPVIDTTQLEHIRAAANSNFNEVSWFVPTVGGNIIEAKLNVLLGQVAWDVSTLPRSAWINQSVIGPPVGADPTTNFILQHETSNDADGQAMDSFFQTGYFVMSEADVLLFVDQVWPDFKWGYGTSTNAEVLLTFFVAEYPTDPNPQQYGPFTLSQAVQYVTPRFRGRLVSLRFESVDVGTWWRLGAVRYRYAPDGKFL